MEENPIYPDVKVWEFVNKRTKESRSYEQSELTIDGEMQFFRLAGDAVAELRAADFPFDRIPELFPEDGDLTAINLALVQEMLTVVASKAAHLITRGVCVMLGVFEFDEHNRPNPEYKPNYDFLRATIHTADVVEMVEVFVQQNDIERLRQPFSRAWKAATTQVPSLQPPGPLPSDDASSMTPSTSSSAVDTAASATSGGSSRGDSTTERLPQPDAG